MPSDRPSTPDAPALAVVRCDSCGGEYDQANGSTHCMFYFAKVAHLTELLGRYVTRAEKAEEDNKRLRAALAAAHGSAEKMARALVDAARGPR